MKLKTQLKRIMILFNYFVVIAAITMMLATGWSSGVNSFVQSGNSEEDHHASIRNGVLRVNDELEDYYTNEGQSHLCYENGLSTVDTMAVIQQKQPQHFIQICHGDGDQYKGRRQEIGQGDDEDLMTVSMMSEIQVGRPGSFMSAGAPFMASFLISCYAGSGDDENSVWWDVYMDDLNAWLWVAIQGDSDGPNSIDFIEIYSDRATDKEYTYRKAIDTALDRCGSGVTIRRSYTTGGSLQHATIDDYYRSIRREEEHEGSFLYYGTPKSMEFDISNYDAYENGIYFVTNGIIDADYGDLTSTTDLRIKAEKWVDNSWETIKTYWYNDLQNTEFEYQGESQYVGSGTCSLFVGAGHLTDTNTLRYTVSIDDYTDDGDRYHIDRFEAMLIGGKE